MELTLLNVFGLTAFGRDFNDREKRNITAFLEMIAWAEGMYEKELNPRGLNGQNGWNVTQNWGTFNYNRLPNGCNEAPAFGKFQIEGKTWCDRGFSNKPPTPQNQLELALQLLKSHKREWVKGSGYQRIQATSAYDDALKGDFIKAIKKVAGRWSAMPFSRSPKPRANTYEKCLNYIISKGGIPTGK